MIDLHCHILPDIDDGAETVSDSIDLLCEEQKQGVDSIVFTPHFNFERTNLHDFCLAREHSMQSLNKALTQRNIDISVKLGAEVYFSVRMLDEDIEPLCFGDTNYILVEFPVNSRPYGLSRTMEDLIRRGYIPILAHVERYPYFSENVNELYDLVMKGCLAQVNAGAIIKSHASSLIMKYIKWEMVHIISTDCHSIKKRPPNMQEAFSIIDKRLGLNYKEWLIKNSIDVFNGRYIDMPVIKKPRKFLGKWI